jgi:hypothetical protein
MSCARAILMALDPPFFPLNRSLAERELRTAGDAGTATASTAVLLTAAPDHCGPPGPVVSPVAVLRQPGFETPPPHRHACTAARQFVSAGLSRSRLKRNRNRESPQCLLQRVQILMRSPMRYPLGRSADVRAVRRAGSWGSRGSYDARLTTVRWASREPAARRGACDPRVSGGKTVCARLARYHRPSRLDGPVHRIRSHAEA